MTESRDPFVGRDHEMAQLAEALEDALAGHGRLVMLVGEPGIGKTRTAEELAAIAIDRKVRVAWGRCLEDAGTPPFWPWTQIVRAFKASNRPSEPQDSDADRPSDLRDVWSPADASSPGNEMVDLARFRLFERYSGFLGQAAAGGPLVVILDNLHWADSSSLQLLEFVTPDIASLPLLVLGTYRDMEIARGKPLFRSLGELARHRHFRRIMLRGLDLNDIDQIVTSTGVPKPPRRLVEQIHANTEGNPFFVREIVTLLKEEADLAGSDIWTRDPTAVHVPEGIKEAIGRRLDRLSQQCNAVLAVASVIGREFDASLLGRLVIKEPSGSGGDTGAASQRQQMRRQLGFQTARATTREDRRESPASGEGGDVPNTSFQTAAILEILAEADQAHVLENVPELGGRFRFVHALFQRTLREEIPTARRVRIHAAIATTLDEIYAGRRREHASELAFHYAEAEPLLGVDKVISYSIVAGEGALAIFAQEEAHAHFERAQAAVDARPEPADDATTAAILAGLARSILYLTPGQVELQRHWEFLARAFDLYLILGERDKAADLAKLPFPFGGVRGTHDLISRALQLVPEGSEDAGWLSARLGVALMDDKGDFAAAHSALDTAHAVGVAHQNQALQARALVHRTQVLGAQDRHEEVAVQGLAAIDASRRARDPWSEIRVPGFVGSALAAIGDPINAVRVNRSHLELARRLRLPALQQLILVSLFHVSRLTGDWAQTKRLIAEREKLGALPSRQAMLEAVVKCNLGPVEDGLQELQIVVENLIAEGWGRQQQVGIWGPGVLAATACAHGGEGALTIAQKAAEQLLAYQPPLPRPAHVAEHVMGFVAVAHSDVAAAGPLYRAILPRRAHLDPYGGFSIDRLLALLAMTVGEPETAWGHFEDALTFCRRAGYRPEVAWSCHDYANALLQVPGNIDRSKLASLLTEGSGLASQLGMAPLSAKFEALQERLRTKLGGRPEYPDSLTEREVEVLRLIAGGRSNAEIAEALVITPNTAAKHVANILTKINASNRAEAASYAHQHGLMEQRPK